MADLESTCTVRVGWQHTQELIKPNTPLATNLHASNQNKLTSIQINKRNFAKLRAR